MIVKKKLAARDIEPTASEIPLVTPETVNWILAGAAHQTINVLLIVVTLHSTYAQAQIVNNQVQVQEVLLGL